MVPDVIIGASRILPLFKEAKRTIILKGNYSKVLSYIQDNKDREKIVVLVSGDPGMFSFSKQITKTLDLAEYEVIPGISSLQLAFARIGESWEDACILSLHGRTKRGLYDAVSNNKKVFVFTDKKNTPASIASFLYKRGITKREIIILENLSLADERIIHTDINSLTNNKEETADLCVMIIKK